MTAILPNVPYWQPALGALGQFVTGLDELAQAIRIILTTPKGSLPHRPDFGCSFLEVMDQPQGLATARIIREVMEAVAQYEPRVQVTRVRVERTAQGASTVTVLWIPAGDPSTAPVATAVALDAQGAATATGGAYVPTSAVGAPGGVAPLDAKGQVPALNLPATFGPTSGGGGDLSDAVVDGGELV